MGLKMMNYSNNIIIVGAGLSGLVSAAYLTQNGLRVTLIEKNNQCGGLLNSFEHDGFIFDVGAKSIENSGIIKPLFKDLKIDIELLNSPVSIGIEEDIIPFSSMNDINSYKFLLIKKFPKNEVEIEKIFKVIVKIAKSMEIIYGFDNPIFKENFTKDKTYLLHELLPWLPKFLLSINHMNRMDEPIDEFLTKYTKNQSLIDMISQHFFKKTSTFFALGYFYVYQDYLYPKGGTREIVNKLEEKIIENGGNIIFNTNISYIDSEKRVIIDDENISYSYSQLIWCADLHQLYNIVDLEHFKENKKIIKKRDQILKNRGGDSVFSLYLGVNKELEYFKNISNGHFFYTPNKKGLNNIQYSQLSDIIDNFGKYSKKEIFNWIDNYCSYNTFEISIPSLRDPLLSPKGKTGVIINFFFEYDIVRKIKASGWYEEFKSFVEEKIIDILNNSIYPILKENLLFKFSYTPLSIEKKINNNKGAITGWSYENETPVYNKITQIGKSIKTPFDNIYQAGQWAYSPAGIPTAILTGWYSAKEVIENY